MCYVAYVKMLWSTNETRELTTQIVKALARWATVRERECELRALRVHHAAARRGGWSHDKMHTNYNCTQRVDEGALPTSPPHDWKTSRSSPTFSPLSLLFFLRVARLADRFCDAISPRPPRPMPSNRVILSPAMIDLSCYTPLNGVCVLTWPVLCTRILITSLVSDSATCSASVYKIVLCIGYITYLVVDLQAFALTLWSCTTWTPLVSGYSGLYSLRSHVCIIDCQIIALQL